MVMRSLAVSLVVSACKFSQLLKSLKLGETTGRFKWRFLDSFIAFCCVPH